MDTSPPTNIYASFQRLHKQANAEIESKLKDRVHHAHGSARRARERDHGRGGGYGANGRIGELLEPPESSSHGGVTRMVETGGSGGIMASAGATSYARDVTRSMHIDENLVATIFFGRDNLEALQTGLRNRVLDRTQGRLSIGRQSEVDLLVFMRGVYADHARHDDTDPIEQVRGLNTTVLDKCVDVVISGAQQYEGYLRDAATMPSLLDRPMYVDPTGTKSSGWSAPLQASP